VKFHNYPYGRVFKYQTDRHPDKRLHYVIGADSASGLPNRDKSAYQVLCLETHEQVACFAEECAPNHFAEELRKVGTYFYNATVGVELDKYGFLTINILKDIYPYLYFHIQSPTSYGTAISKEYGWKPTSPNRQVAIDYLKMDFSANGSENEAEKKSAIKIFDSQTYEEMAFFIKDRETGKEAAQKGKKDDRLAALWIADFMWHEMQIRFEFKEQDNTPKPMSIVQEMEYMKREGEANGKGFGPRKLVV